MQQEYIKEDIAFCVANGLPVKNWDFPKVHLLRHAFDDITRKGVTRNSNTKPNEKMHGPIRQAYLLMTNFRDVGEQVSLEISVMLT